MFQHILVVCTGNICRSPVAAAMLRQRLPGRDISSAGLGALVGSDVEPRARALAEADGIEVGAHKARQLDTDLLSQADLILVMSDGQRREIGKQWPEMLGKTLRLGQWLEGGEGETSPTPIARARRFSSMYTVFSLRRRKRGRRECK
ncbi:low molecular weight protein-tyrosine-phosphatase [Halomonas sp. E19]|uniref:low molecular weight protein-tyrosine-phosphatase n=1 Tax=Halomonas sp. E19 TaxID=3397247 RepID=UPI004033C848